jgi:hypothetical protein
MIKYSNKKLEIIINYNVVNLIILELFQFNYMRFHSFKFSFYFSEKVIAQSIQIS